MVSSKITPRICLIFYRKVRQIWGVIGVYIDYNMGSIYSTNNVKNKILHVIVVTHAGTDSHVHMDVYMKI